jgi:hypothetical protein
MVPDEYLEDNYKLLVERVFENDKLINKQPSYFKNMVEAVKERSVKQFPYFQPNKLMIGFRNGVLDIDDVVFWETERVPKDIIVGHYIDNDLDLNNLATPLFDQMILNQIKDQEALNWLKIFVIRLHFPSKI